MRIDCVTQGASATRKLTAGTAACEIALVSTQIVLAIWVSASLFRAFAASYDRNGAGISRPEACLTATPSHGDDSRTDTSEATFEMGKGSTLARLSRLWAGQ